MHKPIQAVEVRIWGKTVGAVALDPRLGYYAFEYDPRFLASGIDLAPLAMPLAKGGVSLTRTPPIHRPFGVPCAARQAGRLRNSRCALRQCSPTAPGRPACAARRWTEGKKINPIPTLTLPLKGRGSPVALLSLAKFDINPKCGFCHR